MKKDTYIMVRINAEEKKMAIKRALKNGFDSLSNFIRYLIRKGE